MASEAKTKAKALDNAEIERFAEGMIADCVSYDSSERKNPREYALAYQAGEMPDLPAGKDKSSVVSQDIADAIAQLMPNIMRIFLSADKVGCYEPEKPGDEEYAEQATDYINYALMRECDGESLLRDSFHDGFLLGNGIIKHWWDDTKEYRTYTYSDLDDDAFVELVSGDDVEVLEHSERPAPLAEPPGPDADQGLGGPAGVPGLGQLPGPEAGGMPQIGPGAPAPLAPQPAPPGMGAPAGAGAIPGAGVPAPAVPAAPAHDGSAVPAVSGGLPPGGLPGALIPALGDNGGPPPMLHDVKIRKVISYGRMRVMSVPDEDFGIESGATGLNERECRFCYHRETPTRSDLIERGYAQDIVWELAQAGESVEVTSNRARRNSGSYQETYEDKAGERVEVYECYARLDVDGDGIAEWHQIIMAGPDGAQKMLDHQEWDAMLPFTDIVPDPVPHVWRGRSIYDRLRDVQRVKTVLQRKMLDNLYQTLEPMRAADMRMIENPDALFDLRLGGVVRTKGDPRAAVTDLSVPFVAKEAAPMIEAMDRVAERRVGVGEQSSGLDHDALQGQVATAVNAMQSASGLRKEDYARNIQVGMRRLFRALLRISVQHQDKERTVRLRGEWVKIDPAVWNSDMDVTINTGLGAGNRDRDLQMLQGIAAKQEMILQVMGPTNPVLPLSKYIKTLQMMCEAAGLRSPEQFFPDVDDNAVKAAAAQQGQKPDPKMAAAQAQLQIAQQKAQSDAQLSQMKMQADQQMNAAKMQGQQQIMEAKLQADMRVREAEMQHKMELDRVKAQQDIAGAQQKAQIELQVQQAKADAQLQIQREKAQADLHIRTIELQLEAQLKQQQAAAQINTQHATDLEMPQ